MHTGLDQASSQQNTIEHLRSTYEKVCKSSTGPTDSTIARRGEKLGEGREDERCTRLPVGAGDKLCDYA
jgi:hypothetical protein